MTILDIAITVLAVGISLWYLYRRIIVNRGCTCGSSCSKSATRGFQNAPVDVNRDDAGKIQSATE